MSRILYIMIIILSIVEKYNCSEESSCGIFYHMSQKWFSTNISYQKILNCSNSCIGKKVYKRLIINCDYQVEKLRPGCLQKGSVPGIHQGAYFSPNIQLSWATAVRWCRSRGLELADVRTLNKEAELIALIDKHPKLSITKFWFAATDAKKPGDTPYWISDGLAFNSQLNKGNKKSACFNAIVSDLKILHLKWSANDCQEVNSFICYYPSSCYYEKCFEPKVDWQIKKGKKMARYKYYKKKPLGPCEAPTINKNDCPKLINKTLSAEIQQTKGGYVNKSNFTGYIVNACGVRLFFGTVEKSFLESYAICCSMGFNLISIETVEKMNCIINLLNDSMPAKLAFWTSGYDLKCEGDYIWSSSSKFVSPNAPWLPGEPSYVGAYHLNFYVSDKSSGFIDSHGGSSLKFICEGTLEKSSPIINAKDEVKIEQESTMPMKINPRPLLFRPKLTRHQKAEYELNINIGNLPKMCSMYQCTKEEKEISFNLKRFETNLDGNLVRACKKYYFFSREMTDFNTVTRKCCKIGMRVLSINSVEEMNCVHDVFKDLGFPGRVYFIKTLAFQGTNPNKHPQIINGSFDNCEENGPEPVNKDLWFPGEPNNLSGLEYCAVVRFSPSSARGLFDCGCSGAPFSYNHYVCEEA